MYIYINIYIYIYTVNIRYRSHTCKHVSGSINAYDVSTIRTF